MVYDTLCCVRRVTHFQNLTTTNIFVALSLHGGSINFEICSYIGLSLRIQAMFHVMVQFSLVEMYQSLGVYKQRKLCYVLSM
jgi:hypothetical protein